MAPPKNPSTVSVTISWPKKYALAAEQEADKMGLSRSAYHVRLYEERHQWHRAREPVWDAVLALAVRKNIGPLSAIVRLIEIGLKYSEEFEADDQERE